tara:strand:+ start:9674 stop:10159 length:486 start_codon:yes stop_codon:yes gene_type:complete
MAKKSKKKNKKPIAPRDVGTNELQLKKALLVGTGDPSFSESVIGIMFARGFINEYQLKAAQQYSNLRRKIFGSPFPQTSDLIGSSRGLGDIDEMTEIRIRDQYDQAALGLRDCGQVIKIAVEKIVIYEIMPHSLLNSPRLNKVFLDDIRIGLNSLCKSFGI